MSENEKSGAAIVQVKRIDGPSVDELEDVLPDLLLHSDGLRKQRKRRSGRRGLFDFFIFLFFLRFATGNVEIPAPHAEKLVSTQSSYRSSSEQGASVCE